MRDHDGWKRLLADVPLPAAVVDLDALDANLATLVGALGERLTLRVASKSIRVPRLMRHLLDQGGGRLRGLMTYSAHETAWLADQGFDDLLLAYPIGRADEAAAIARAARKAVVRTAVDHVDQARLLSAAAEGAGLTLKVCLDLDVSWRPLGGRAHLGVRRSPLRDAAAAVALAEQIRRLPGLEVDSVLAYEAQVAGLPDLPGDDVAGRAMGLVHRAIKAASVPLAADRRGTAVDALRSAGFRIGLVNGGGTGSVRSTSTDRSVTEATAGSGFVDSHLFDHYRDLRFVPALFFALGVVRSSDPDHVTCAGGGYVASGPAGPSRLPIVHAPSGLQIVPIEGFGEVQTPFRRTADAPALKIGDPVICRPAKAGELAERFPRYLLVRGDHIVDVAETTRGAGQCFF